eukprot:Opistho-2@14927
MARTRDDPVRVERVHVDGLRVTKSDVVARAALPLFEAETLGSLVETARAACLRLEKLGIFKTVEMVLDTTTKSDDGKALEVLVRVEEKRRLEARTGTTVGQNEGALQLALDLRNVNGRGEMISANYSKGTRTTSAYHVTFSKPISGDPDKSLVVVAHKSTQNLLTINSHNEISQGLSVAFNFLTRYGRHSFSFDPVWREIVNVAPTASFAVRQQAGHSLKTAFKHTFLTDTRDDTMLPLNGTYFKAVQEFAGIGGSTQFVKHDFEFQTNKSTAGNSVSFQLSMRGGLMYPLMGARTHLSDRFFLGGPLNIRGFPMKSVGPREKDDPLGGDISWAAAAHVFLPFPWRPIREKFGRSVRTHFFATVGNVSAFDKGTSFGGNIRGAFVDPRASVGLGLAVRLGVARLEVNYCHPLLLRAGDAAKSGVQVGVGLEFL